MSEVNRRPTVTLVPAHLSVFDFNISHDEGLVAGASSARGRVGIDVMRAKVREVSGFFTEFLPSLSEALTAREYRWIQASPCPVDLLFALWTVKEAYVKARGDGIGFGLKRIECDGSPADFPPLEHLQSATPEVLLDGQPVPKDKIIFITTSIVKVEAGHQTNRYFKTTCEILP